MNSAPSARLFLADFIRLQEGGSKPDLIGYYVDGLINVHLPEAAPDPTRDAPISLTMSALVHVENNSVGQLQSVQIIAPDGKGLSSEPIKVQFSFPPKPGSIGVIFALPNFPIVAFGKYQMNIVFERQSYALEFSIRRGPPSPEQVNMGKLNPVATTAESIPKKKAKS